MTITIETLMTVLSSLFGGTGVIAYLGARKERIAQANISEAGAIAAMQGVYRNLILDTDIRIKDMQNEITMLHKIVTSYKENCSKCAHNLTK